jgi:hypothetical protein
LMARCRRVYAHAHDYHINSISNNRLFLFFYGCLELLFAFGFSRCCSSKVSVIVWFLGSLLYYDKLQYFVYTCTLFSLSLLTMEIHHYYLESTDFLLRKSDVVIKEQQQLCCLFYCCVLVAHLVCKVLFSL